MAISPLSAARTACEELNWEISNLELQKHLYLAHMTFLGRNNGDPLLTENFEAWDYGPVIPSLYHKAKIFGADKISSLPRVRRNLNLNEHAVIREVVSYFSDKRPGELIDLTHRPGGAWDLHYVPGVHHIIIPDDDIFEEYRRRTQSRG